MIVHPLGIMASMFTANWSAESNQFAGNFGWSVSSAGDVNGDGHADIIVGAPYYDNGQIDEGRSFVYLGSAAGLAATPDWTAESDTANAKLGHTVAGGGDVNGDGFDDVLITSWGMVNSLEGMAAVFHGSGVGPDMSPSWTVQSPVYALYDHRGAFAGDVNGDGFDDVIVGAFYYYQYHLELWVESQYAFVFHGSVAGLSPGHAWSEVSYGEDRFGHSVGSAGDVDGDGYGDVIVGAPDYFGEGHAHAYLGSSTGLAQDAAWTATEVQTGSGFGASVSSAGDVNADGYGDVVVGASYFDNPESTEGRAVMFLGSAGGLDTAPAWDTEADQPSAIYGVSVASAGDVNADGFDDVVVGATLWDGSVVDEGAAFVFLGSATGLETAAEIVLSSGQTSSRFGEAVAGAGDVDADGSDDILVGASGHENGEIGEGGAFLFLGSCSDPVDTDGDHVGDRCDVCPASYDPMQEDDDADGIGDVCDPCPGNSPDADLDGFCAAEECDDSNATVYPGAAELCDGLDNACSGWIDPAERDVDRDGEPICAGDCDDADPTRSELDADGDGWTSCAGDCDDASAVRSPAIFEQCGDGLDNDCDGPADEACGEDARVAADGCACDGAGAGGTGLPILALVYGRSRTRTARSSLTASSVARHAAPSRRHR